MRGVLRGVVAVGVAALASFSAINGAAAKPPPPLPDVPFSIDTLSAEAGYYRFHGSCPKNTTKLRFSWTPSQFAKGGWGEVSLKPKTFTGAQLRMQSTVPGEVITAKFECQTAGSKTKKVFGPVQLAGGSDLLALPPADTGTGRRIVYSLSAEQLWAFAEDGSVARTYLVSGRRVILWSGYTQLGKFAVFSKSKMGCILPIRCPNMVRFHRMPHNNIGFHAIPFSKAKGFWQTPAELGQPRSGGCVRAAPENAEWLFNWAVKGDPVYVIE